MRRFVPGDRESVKQEWVKHEQLPLLRKSKLPWHYRLDAATKSPLLLWNPTLSHYLSDNFLQSYKGCNTIYMKGPMILILGLYTAQKGNLQLDPLVREVSCFAHL